MLASIYTNVCSSSHWPSQTIIRMKTQHSYGLLMFLFVPFSLSVPIDEPIDAASLNDTAPVEIAVAGDACCSFFWFPGSGGKPGKFVCWPYPYPGVMAVLTLCSCARIGLSQR